MTPKSQPALKSSNARTSGAAPAARHDRKSVVGRVVSDKMDKTIVVQVERIVRDPRFGKFLKKYSKCYAHDEKGDAKEGDRVQIAETRPLSKSKRWRLVAILEKGAVDAPVPGPEVKS